MFVSVSFISLEMQHQSTNAERKQSHAHKPTSRLICLFFDSFCARLLLCSPSFTPASLALFLPPHLVIINACMHASISKYFTLPIFRFHHFRTGFRSKRDPWWFLYPLDRRYAWMYYYYCCCSCCCCYYYDCLYLFFFLRSKKWIKSKNHPKYLLFLSEPLKIYE